MVVLTRTVQIKSKGENDMIDITQQTAALVREGNNTCYNPGLRFPQ